MNPVFRYSHWAGITDYTSPFGVAVCYVVIRQSGRSCHCDLLNLWAGTPYPKVTGLICRVPLTQLLPTRLRLFSEGHLCQFSVRTVSPFSRAPGISIVTPLQFRNVLTITVLRFLIQLRRSDGSAMPILKRQDCLIQVQEYLPVSLSAYSDYGTS